MMQLVQRSFGLSKRQAEIALAITEGMSSEEISDQLGISPNTVRHHTKIVYARMQVRKQIEVSSIVSQLNYLKSQSPASVPHAIISSQGPYLSSTKFVNSPKHERRVCYSECGRRDGTPCLMFHSSFGGRWVEENSARAFWRANLRLFIVERPGIGLTDSAGDGDRMDTAIEDAFTLLESAGIEHVHGMSFSGGAFYLAEAARRKPEYFASVNFISPRAFCVSSQPAQQNNSTTVQKLSGLPVAAAELINESTNSDGEHVGWREMIRLTLAENPVDLQALEDESLMEMHINQARSNLVMGASGVGLEWRDFGANFDPPEIVPALRYTVTAGADDNIETIRRGVDDWSDHLNIAPKLVSGAGHLVLLTHTKSLLQALELA